MTFNISNFPFPQPNLMQMSHNDVLELTDSNIYCDVA